MCDYFEDFDWEFMEDEFDDGAFDDDMDGSADPDFNDELNQEDDQNDGFDVEDAFYTGSLFGFAYEEGRLRGEKRKRKNADSDDPSDID